jgi:hypothetical protein
VTNPKALFDFIQSDGRSLTEEQRLALARTPLGQIVHQYLLEPHGGAPPDRYRIAGCQVIRDYTAALYPERINPNDPNELAGDIALELIALLGLILHSATKPPPAGKG